MSERTRERLDKEAKANARARARAELIEQIGVKVREQAGADTFPMKLKDGRQVQVPKAPFVQWALRMTNNRDKAPDWEPVSPIGLKMEMDDPNHSDWVLGAGLSLGESYKDIVNEPAMDAAFKFQEQARQPQFSGITAALDQLRGEIHEAAVIVNAGERTGVVGTDIVVFPDSDGPRAKQLGDAVGAIVEKGGALAHFAIVSKGKGVTVMRHPDACELFQPGTQVQLNPKSGRIVILDDD
jgi:phosphohistidine swiveling domain-containing protein